MARCYFGEAIDVEIFEAICEKGGDADGKRDCHRGARRDRARVLRAALAQAKRADRVFRIVVADSYKMTVQAGN
jgi:hypothetical protein